MRQEVNHCEVFAKTARWCTSKIPSENLGIQSHLVTEKILTKVSSNAYLHSYFIKNMLDQGGNFTTRYPGTGHPSEC